MYRNEGLGKMKICFLLRSLHVGGTERQLVALARQLSASSEVSIITFYPGGALEGELAAIPQIHLYSLAKKGRWDFLCFARLYRLLKQINPEVLYTMLETS